jgi:hypothetical protein
MLDDRLEWRRDVERRIAAAQRAPRFLPPIAHTVNPVHPAGIAGWWSITVPPTGGAWVPVWQTWAPRITHQAIRAGMPVVTDATGDGDVRLRITADGGIDRTTDFRTSAFGVNLSYAFIWAHALAPWTTTNVDFYVEARVRAANFLVFPPYGGAIIEEDPRAAVADGTPT